MNREDFRVSYPPAASTAKTYSLIAVILCFVAAAIWVVLGPFLAFLLRSPSLGIVLGVLAVVIAVLIYITTYDRIRIGDFEGAKGPCLVWGFLGLIFGWGIPGIFLILAHSKLSEIPPYRAPPPTVGPPLPGRRAEGTICFGCGSVIPSTATSCPRCGKPR